MKMLLTAIALTIAYPVAAQTAAPTPSHDHHSGHAAHGQHGTQHGQAHSGHGQSADAHAQHQMKGECCDKMADGKMMDCCKKMAAEGKKPCCDQKQAKPKANAPAAHHNH